MSQEKINQRAKAWAAAKSDFYRRAAIAGGVSLVLAGINLATSPDKLWFWWVVLAMAIGLAMRAVKIFAKVKVEEYQREMIEKEQAKDQDQSPRG